MKYPDPDWLLALPPREVQLEAMRRSYYGYKLRDHRDGPENPVLLRPDGRPARGWGQLAEMRLGKTAMILNEFMLFKRDYGVTKLVVISPNSYKDDWAEECVKYGIDVPAIAYEQSRLPHMVDFVQKNPDGFVLIVNYEATYYDQTQAFLQAIIDDKTMIAADESIKLKNPEGLFFKSAMLLAKPAGVTRIATGLPFTQGPQDFYAQGRFIRMYDGLNYYAYRNRYCLMGGYKRKKIVGVKNEERLNEEISQNAFVAKRKDWGNQTDASYYIMRFKLEDAQKKAYAEIDKQFITLLEDGTEISAEQVMSQLMKLQQISSGFAYTEDGRAVEIMDPRKTPKMKRLVEFMEDELVGKLVVPFHYSKSGDMLLEVLEKYQPAVIRGDEWMRREKRDVISEKQRFNHDSQCRVMLLQIAAGKYGHDLSGNPDDRTAAMVFFENTYSLDDRGQVEARINTAFQDWDSIYIDLISSPAEKKAVDALVKKESVVEAVLGAYREGKQRRDYGS